MSLNRPQIGQITCLVYRECPQGCWCATGEAGSAPLCAFHRQPMMPGGGPKGQYDHPQERRLGFAALFGQETAMATLIGRLRGLFGYLPYIHDTRRGYEDRYFSEDEIDGDLRERGWDGERWPEPVV